MKEKVRVNTENRIIILSADITEESISIVSDAILNMITEDGANKLVIQNYKVRPIKLFINSYGGDVYDCMQLIDIIENSTTPIKTFCLGKAMSAGFLIFLAGHYRYMSKNATLMYHQVSQGTYGTCAQILEDIEELTYMQDKIEKYVLEKTKISKKKLEEVRKCKKDWYIHSEEALKLGITDTILDNQRRDF